MWQLTQYLQVMDVNSDGDLSPSELRTLLVWGAKKELPEGADQEDSDAAGEDGGESGEGGYDEGYTEEDDDEDDDDEEEEGQPEEPADPGDDAAFVDGLSEVTTMMANAGKLGNWRAKGSGGDSAGASSDAGGVGLDHDEVADRAAEVGDAPQQEVEAMGLEEELLLRLRSLDEVLGSGAT